MKKIFMVMAVLVGFVWVTFVQAATPGPEYLIGTWHISAVSKAMLWEKETRFETDTDIEIAMCKDGTLRNTIIRPSDKWTFEVVGIGDDTVQVNISNKPMISHKLNVFHNLKIWDKRVALNIKSENEASTVIYSHFNGFPRENIVTMLRISRNVAHSC